VIACYNSRQWIGQAIESALAQSWPDKEVLVYDDGSTDGSQEVIEAFGSRIQMELGVNRGASAARNRLVQRVSGEWLQILDGDDYLLPDKVERQLQWLDSELANVDILFSPTFYERIEDGESTGRHPGLLHDPLDPWVLLVKNQLPQTGGPLWRRTALLEVGGFAEEDDFGLEDLVYLKLLSAGKVAEFCPEIGAVYRLWGGHTLGQKKPREFCQTRLAIIDEAERHLKRTGQLNPARKDAIAFGRLDCARTVYPLDQQLAIAAATRLRAEHPAFQVPPGDNFPRTYRWSYRLLGFSGSERLAATLRKLRRKTRST
jgi:glycosyltransferase involved in cell wall biosynthesis